MAKDMVDLIGGKRQARPGHVWVYTIKGEQQWRSVCARMGWPDEEAERRRVGTPVWEYYRDPNYKREVPALWAELGFVAEAPENQNQRSGHHVDL